MLKLRRLDGVTNETDDGGHAGFADEVEAATATYIIGYRSRCCRCTNGADECGATEWMVHDSRTDSARGLTGSAVTGEGEERIANGTNYSCTSGRMNEGSLADTTNGRLPAAGWHGERQA